MSIMELGALGEFIGSILVLGTLVYLAAQVRQGIAHSRFTTNYAIAGAGHAAWLAVAPSPELAAVMAKLETGEPVVGSERAQTWAFATTLMLFYINAASAIHEGLIVPESLPLYQADLGRVLAKYPGLRPDLLEMVGQLGITNSPIWERLRDEVA
jgi:hypothetical protein